jgi:hypothetical protein
MGETGIPKSGADSGQMNIGIGFPASESTGAQTGVSAQGEKIAQTEVWLEPSIQQSGAALNRFRPDPAGV